MTVEMPPSATATSPAVTPGPRGGAGGAAEAVEAVEEGLGKAVSSAILAQTCSARKGAVAGAVRQRNGVRQLDQLAVLGATDSRRVARRGHGAYGEATQQESPQRAAGGADVPAPPSAAAPG